MTARTLLAVGVDALAAFVLLGIVVSRMQHSAFDLHAARLRGRAVEIAVVLTRSGRTRPLTAVGIAAFVVFLVMRWPLWIPAGVLLSQIASQAVVEGVKRLYGRRRPNDYLIRREYGFSYPSGHASSAITFYGAWALVAWFAPIPLWVRAPLAGALFLWGAGVAWSRLALSAHFFTDVLGGLLFGAGWLCVMLAIAQHMHAFA